MDAFKISSWNQSECRCGERHRETCLIFPPIGLERVAFKRARSDDLRVVFIVSTSYKAGYWKGLRNHAIARMQLTDPGSDFAGVQAPLGITPCFGRLRRR